MHEKSETLPLLVGVEKACELLAIRRTHVYKLIAEEKLRPVKLGRRTVFRYADLVAFADQMGRATA
jgi:excisionase family DNA binding protein